MISGGNFHGQPVAQALDVLAMTLTTLKASPSGGWNGWSIPIFRRAVRPSDQ